MTSTSREIIFFGTEDFSLTVLQRLVAAGYHIAAVVTKPDSKKGRGHKLTSPSVKIYAELHSIPVWQPKKLIEINEKIARLNPVTGVLVSYGKIIPNSTIQLFTPGIINVHPSLLPKYRGPSPIESAILNGDSETGVTIMQLTAAMDAGPIYATTRYPLTGMESQPELYENLASIGADLLLSILDKIIGNQLSPTPQNDSDATYCNLIRKDDAFVDPLTVSAASAEQHVRAYIEFPKTKLTIGGHTIIVTKAHVTDKQKTPLDIRCQDGAFLSIDELIAPSGRRISSADFLRGYAA